MNFIDLLQDNITNVGNKLQCYYHQLWSITHFKWSILIINILFVLQSAESYQDLSQPTFHIEQVNILFTILLV